MIGRLRGILIAKRPPFLLIDILGVAYEVQASMNTIYSLPQLDQEVVLYTQMIVREDAQLLYAFADEQEKQIFNKLIKISGVGPKLALAILSGMNVQNVLQCIRDKDHAGLVKLPGVGKKTAERIVIEMQDKIDAALITKDFSEFAITARQDAVSALIALGYKEADASKSIDKIYQEDADSETLIRLALQQKA